MGELHRDSESMFTGAGLSSSQGYGLTRGQILTLQEQPCGATQGPMIRQAREQDAPAVAAIYAHHVLHGTASYDTQPPSEEDTRAKIRRVLAAGWPFLVSEQDEQVVG